MTITAGTGSADVTVSAAALPVGTVLWSNPGDRSGVVSILPAVPSPTGVADVFALQNDGTVQAIASDGTTAWKTDLSAYVSNTFGTEWGTVRPDFQGGLVLQQTNNCPFCPLMKLDGITGQPYPAYTPAGFSRGYLVHTDGTIFNVEDSATDNSATVVAVNPTTGTSKFSVQLFPAQTESSLFAGPFNSAMVAGDGYAYWGYLENDAAGAGWTSHLMVFRVNSRGAQDTIHLADWGSAAPNLGAQGWWVTPNADQGVVVNWVTSAGVGGMAVTTGTSVNLVSAPVVPGQIFGISQVLAAQDGSFIGEVDTGNQSNMVAFDASGNVRWVVANDQPQIATADGGVIGRSGITYDSNGNATGQIDLQTQS